MTNNEQGRLQRCHAPCPSAQHSLGRGTCESGARASLGVRECDARASLPWWTRLTPGLCAARGGSRLSGAARHQRGGGQEFRAKFLDPTVVSVILLFLLPPSGGATLRA